VVSLYIALLGACIKCLEIFIRSGEEVPKRLPSRRQTEVVCVLVYNGLPIKKAE
jgi:hypothetical protein